MRGNAIPAVTEILEVLEEYAETLAVDDESNTMEEPFRNRRPQRSNLARATGGHTVCPICSGAHAMTKCSQFMAMTVDQRWEVATIVLAVVILIGIVRQAVVRCAEGTTIRCYMVRLCSRDNKHRRQALRRRCYREPD